MATKFTYKMRSGGNGMWGRGPAQRKKKKKKKKNFIQFKGTVQQDG
jgi:hypothetical protein